MPFLGSSMNERIDRNFLASSHKVKAYVERTARTEMLPKICSVRAEAPSLLSGSNPCMSAIRTKGQGPIKPSRIPLESAQATSVKLL